MAGIAGKQGRDPEGFAGDEDGLWRGYSSLLGREGLKLGLDTSQEKLRSKWRLLVNYEWYILKMWCIQFALASPAPNAVDSSPCLMIHLPVS